MVWLYLCTACQRGDHGNCDIGTPAPPGHYGGSKCRCNCGRNPHHNDPAHIQAELRKTIQDLLDFQESSRRVIIDMEKSKPKKLGKVDKLKEKIAKLEEEIREIQSECKHEYVQVTPKGDTGNYDPSNDRYWNEYFCPDCEKRWDGDHKSAH